MAIKPPVGFQLDSDSIKPPAGFVLDSSNSTVHADIQKTGTSPLGEVFGVLQERTPQGRIQHGFDVAGEKIAESKFGQRNPRTGAGVGTVVSMIPDALGFVGPPEEPITALAPKIAAGRQAAVKAAQEAGIPLSRAEQTGSPFYSGLESVLEKTPTGAGPIARFREAQAMAKQEALKKAGREMGTQSGSFEVGQRAKEGFGSELRGARDVRDELYSKVPSDVRVPLRNVIDTADQIIQEQSKYLPTTRNADVLSMAKDIQGASPPPVRPTEITSPNVIGTTGESQYRVAQNIPESHIEPNYDQLSRLRSVLNDKIKANTIVEADGSKALTQSGRDFMRLKASLDKDIESFANAPASPLESMTAKEFKRSYGEATQNAQKYSQTYKNPEVRRLSVTDPEKVVDSIFKKNSQSDINRFRAAVGEGPFDLAKKRFTQDLLDSKNLKLELGRYKEGTLQAIYEPEELKKLQGLSEAFDLILTAEKKAGNPSGTGRQIIGGGSYGAAGYALAAGHPVAAAAILGIPYATSKVLTKTAAGVKIPGIAQKALRGSISSGQRVFRD